MRLLGLDIGDQRIGMAVSDDLGLTAQGLPTLERKNRRADLASLQELIATREITSIIAGMPRNMDGSFGERAEITEHFIQLLEETCNLPCIRWDERLTTRQAERVLRETQQKRKRKTMRDRIAAQLILQSYLDYQHARASHSSDGPSGE